MDLRGHEKSLVFVLKYPGSSKLNDKAIVALIRTRFLTHLFMFETGTQGT